VVLDVRADFGVGLGYAAEFAFPIAVEDDPVDMGTPGIGFPAVEFRSVELDVAGGAGGVVRVEDGFDRAFAYELAVDSSNDFVASRIR